MYRKITNAEILELAQRIKKFELTEGLKNLINKYYNGAHYVHISTEGEYDDEGGTYQRYSGISVYDKGNNELDPDYTLPAFRELKSWSNKSFDEVDDYTKD